MKAQAFSIPRIQMILQLIPAKGKDIARFAGISQSAVSNYVNGARLPSPEVAKKIAAFLGFPARDAASLFERIGLAELTTVLLHTNAPFVTRIAHE